MFGFRSLVLTAIFLVQCAIGGLSVLAAEPPSPSNGSEGELLYDLSDAQALSILRGVGLADVKVDEEEEDRTTFIFSIDGVEGFFRNYHVTKDVRIYIVYDTSEETDRERVESANQWNRRQRWAKTYIDDDGNWVIEADLIVAPGVTEEAIASFVRRFLATRSRFEERFGLP